MSNDAPELPEPGAVARATKDVPAISPRAQRWSKPIMRFMSWANVLVFRLSSGKVGGHFPGGAPVCLVTMRGRRSGQLRTMPLIYVPNGDDVLLVASQGGMDRHPLWYYNIAANPQVEVQVGAQKRQMAARQIGDDEKRRLWPILLSVYPDFDDYQARTARNIPVFVCSPAS
jgi:deazaflavin-dependent oxidoreductase (nitroreductase family)